MPISVAGCVISVVNVCIKRILRKRLNIVESRRSARHSGSSISPRVFNYVRVYLVRKIQAIPRRLILFRFPRLTRWILDGRVHLEAAKESPRRPRRSF